MNANVSKLSYQGCLSILKDLPHVSLNSFNCCGDAEKLNFMKQVIECNINDGLLDEIEVILTLSGE